MKYPVMLRLGAFAWMLAASSLPIQPALSATVPPPSTPVPSDARLELPAPPFAWYDTTHGRANTSRIWIAGQAVLVFDEDQGPVASAVANRLSRFREDGSLDPSAIRAVRRGNRCAVLVGDQELLVFGERFARCQGTPSMQLAEHYVTLLRSALTAPAIARRLSRPQAVAVRHEARPAPSVARPHVAPHPVRDEAPVPVVGRTVHDGDPAQKQPVQVTTDQPSDPLTAQAASPVEAGEPVVVSIVDPASLPASASILPLPATEVTEQVLERLAEPGAVPAPSPVAAATGDHQPSAPVLAAITAPRTVTDPARAGSVSRGGYRGDRANWVAVSRGGYDRRGILVGLASWYGGFFHGRRAADGSRFNMNAFTAAHKTLPFGTILDVRNPRTGKHIFVRVTDRGPYIRGRMLDLSRAAARALGMLGAGVDRVEAVVFKPRKRP